MKPQQPKHLEMKDSPSPMSNTNITFQTYSHRSAKTTPTTRAHNADLEKEIGPNDPRRESRLNEDVTLKFKNVVHENIDFPKAEKFKFHESMPTEVSPDFHPGERDHEEQL